MKRIMEFIQRGRAAQHAADELTMPHGRPAALPDYSQQKAALLNALDSSINVVVETREWCRKNPAALTNGDRLALSTTLKQMGRVCYAVAEDCEGRKG